MIFWTILWRSMVCFHCHDLMKGIIKALVKQMVSLWHVINALSLVGSYLPVNADSIPNVPSYPHLRLSFFINKCSLCHLIHFQKNMMQCKIYTHWDHKCVSKRNYEWQKKSSWEKKITPTPIDCSRVDCGSVGDEHNCWSFIQQRPATCTVKKWSDHSVWQSNKLKNRKKKIKACGIHLILNSIC
jgi:hypothetical protein